jgi:hypothetical protein
MRRPREFESFAAARAVLHRAVAEAEQRLAATRRDLERAAPGPEREAAHVAALQASEFARRTRAELVCLSTIVQRADEDGIGPANLNRYIHVGDRAQVILTDPEYDHVGTKFDDARWMIAAERSGRLAPATALVRVTGWLQLIEVVVSPRVAREELGDALENVRRFEREGRPAWHIYAHAIVCGVLAVWHTWRELFAVGWKKGA